MNLTRNDNSPKKEDSEDRDEVLESKSELNFIRISYVLFYKGLFSLEKSGILNLTQTFLCILLYKKKKKRQLPRNYYKTTLCARLISDTQ